MPPFLFVSGKAWGDRRSSVYRFHQWENALALGDAVKAAVWLGASVVNGTVTIPPREPNAPGAFVGEAVSQGGSRAIGIHTSNATSRNPSPSYYRNRPRRNAMLCAVRFSASRRLLVRWLPSFLFVTLLFGSLRSSSFRTASVHAERRVTVV